MEKALVEYNYDWSVISNEYSLIYRKVFPVNEIDEAICNLIKIDGGVMTLTKLGFILGFAMDDLLVNKEVRFYKDDSEINVFINILKNLVDYHLIEIDDQNATLTSWGEWAIEHKQKFKFYSGSINLHTHLNFEVNSDFYPVKYSNLDLYSHIKSFSESKPYFIPGELSEFTKSAIDYCSYSSVNENIIIDEVSDTFINKREIKKNVIVKLLSDQQSIEVYYNGVYLADITESLLLDENIDLKNNLIKRGLFEILMLSEEIIQYSEFIKYKEFFNWGNIIVSGRIRWSDPNIFNVFLDSAVSSGEVWSLISKACPFEIILQNIDLVSEFLNWSILTNIVSSDQILENFQLSWDIDLAVEKIPDHEILKFIENRLSNKSKEYYTTNFTQEQWHRITSKMPVYDIQDTLLKYPYDLRYITRTYIELTTTNLLKKDYIELDWDWTFITSDYDLDFLSINYNVFAERLNPEKLFLRIASQEDRLLRFLSSTKTNELKQRLVKEEVKISFHDVILNERTLPVLDRMNLISWGTSVIPGVEANKNIIWSLELFKKYSDRIQSIQAIDQVSKSFDSIKIVIDNPLFHWNYENVVISTEPFQLVNYLPQLLGQIPEQVHPRIFSILSNKFNIEEVLEAIKTIPILLENIDFLLIFRKATSEQILNNIIEINSLFQLIPDKKGQIIHLCTEVCPLQFILDNIDFQWDWSFITSKKIPNAEIGSYFEELSEYLDWEVVVRQILSSEYLNNVVNLTKIAVYISQANQETQNRAWSAITASILPENIWPFVSSTSNYDIFKWDWSVISSSSQFMFSKFNDITFLWNNRENIDWIAFSANKLFKNWINKIEFETTDQWFERVTEFIDSFYEYFSWEILSGFNNLTWYEEIIRLYSRYWNWSILSQKAQYFLKYSEKKGKAFLNLRSIKAFKNLVDFYSLSSRSDVIIEPDFVLEYAHKELNLSFLSSNSNFKISTDVFIRKYSDGAYHLTKDRFSIKIADKPWDYLVLSNREDFEIDSNLLLQLSEKPWDWRILSSKAFLTNSLLLETADKPWDFSQICHNENLIFDSNLIKLLNQKATEFEINWHQISSSPNFHITNETLSLIPLEDIPGLNWGSISVNPNLLSETLTYPFLDKYGKFLKWGQLLAYKKIRLSEEIIIKYHKFISPSSLAKYISVDILQKPEYFFILNSTIKELVDWQELCKRPEISNFLASDSFISLNKRYLDWSVISSNIHLPFSESFIKKYERFWDWNLLLQNPVIKEDFQDCVESVIKADRRLDFYIKINQSRSQWTGYIYHFAHLTNAINIIRDKRIKSRNTAVFEDSAGSVVNRRHDAHQFASFYFRPQTPTQFCNEELGMDYSSKYYERALGMGLPKCPIPIFFRFSLKEVLFDENIEYRISNGNMQTGWAMPYSIDSIANYFDFRNVYSTIFNTSDGDYRKYINSSQQEFLIKDSFCFSDYYDYNIIVPSPVVKRYLVDIVDDPIVLRKIIVDSGSFNIFHHNNKSINLNYDEKQLHVSTDYRNPHKFQIKFSSDYLIKEVEGEDIINKSNVIEFKRTISISFSNKPKYELLFYNEIKPNPWTIIQCGTINYNINSHNQSVFNEDIFLDYTPGKLIEHIKVCFPEQTKINFETQVRHYLIETHSILVCAQFEKYFSSIDLVILSRNCFRFFLALHDIGKPLAYKKGNKNDQYQFTSQIINHVWLKTPFSESEQNIVLSLISNDCLGEYLQGYRSLKETQKLIEEMARNAKVPSALFLKILTIYYQCDIAAYTVDAGGLKYLDHLFEYKNNEKIFDNQENRLQFSKEINEKYLQLKNAICL